MEAMDSKSKITHEVGEIQKDPLRFGLQGVKSDIVGSHPLESLCQSSRRKEEEMKRMALAGTYGSAFPLKMDFERQILSRCQQVTLTNQPQSQNQNKLWYVAKGANQAQKSLLRRFQRPSGALGSSMLGLEALTGSLDDFGFEDYLNDPHDSETFQPADLHHGMEVRLGLSKGPACPSFI